MAKIDVATLETTSPRPSAARSRVAGAWEGSRSFRPVLLITAVLFVVLSLTQEGFFTSATLENLLTSVAPIWIVAMGMTFVVLIAGVDLSVGALSALAGIFFAKVVASGVPGWPALALTCLFGFAVAGLLNGLLIGRLEMSFFVVTLASATALAGVVNLWSKTESFTVASNVPTVIGVNSSLGVPMPIWIMAATFMAAYYVQRWTYFGRDVYAVGGSMVAARLSGIRTSFTVGAVYAVSGLCAALSSVLTIGRIGAAAPNVDNNLPLQAVAAVLLGGTRLTGGAGGVVGTALGVLFIGTLQMGLSIAGVPSFWQQIITGAILVLTVLGDRLGVYSRARRRRLVS